MSTKRRTKPALIAHWQASGTVFAKALGRTLDASVDPLDTRDQRYTPAFGSMPESFPPQERFGALLSGYTRAGLVLDQGSEGASIGFGLASTANFLLWLRAGTPARMEPVSPRMIYHMAAEYGRRAGGIGCRSALRAWHHHGLSSDRMWPYRDASGAVRFVAPRDGWSEDAALRPLGAYSRVNGRSVFDMQAAIFSHGAIFVCAAIHRGWSELVGPPGARRSKRRTAPPEIYFRPDFEPLGNHAFAIVGYNGRGFFVLNSWGPQWGLGGIALLTYEDWLRYGWDAWVCSVAAAYVRVGRAWAEQAKAEWQKPLIYGRQSIWLLGAAYLHTLVLDQRSQVKVAHVTHEHAGEELQHVAVEAPQAWLAARSRNKPEDLVLFFTSALHGEERSLNVARTLVPVFLDNEIYPIFVAWDTGIEGTITHTLSSLLELNEIPATAQSSSVHETAARNLTIEHLARNSLLYPFWQQFKASSLEWDRFGGSRALANALTDLSTARKGRLRIHLVGHSAGAIPLMDFVSAAQLPFASCTLLAPACDLSRARAIVSPETGKLRAEKFHLHVLSQALENAQVTGPYAGSMLTLISRALERHARTPLLGLEATFNESTERWWSESSREDLRFWQRIAEHLGDRDRWLHVESRPHVSAGAHESAGYIAVSHASLPQHADVIDQIVVRIRGKSKAKPALNLQQPT